MFFQKKNHFFGGLGGPTHYFYSPFFYFLCFFFCYWRANPGQRGVELICCTCNPFFGRPTRARPVFGGLQIGRRGLTRFAIPCSVLKAKLWGIATSLELCERNRTREPLKQEHLSLLLWQWRYRNDDGATCYCEDGTPVCEKNRAPACERGGTPTRARTTPYVQAVAWDIPIIVLRGAPYHHIH